MVGVVERVGYYFRIFLEQAMNVLLTELRAIMPTQLNVLKTPLAK